MTTEHESILLLAIFYLTVGVCFLLAWRKKG